MQTQNIGETFWQNLVSHVQPVASWIVDHPIVPMVIAAIIAFIVIFGRKY